MISTTQKTAFCLCCSQEEDTGYTRPALRGSGRASTLRPLGSWMTLPKTIFNYLFKVTTIVNIIYFILYYSILHVFLLHYDYTLYDYMWHINLNSCCSYLANNYFNQCLWSHLLCPAGSRLRLQQTSQNNKWSRLLSRSICVVLLSFMMECRI